LTLVTKILLAIFLLSLFQEQPQPTELRKRSNFPCCQGMGLIPIMMSAKLSNSSKVVTLGISVNKYLMAS
jgi:hypothetical protein